MCTTIQGYKATWLLVLTCTKLLRLLWLALSLLLTAFIVRRSVRSSEYKHLVSEYCYLCTAAHLYKQFLAIIFNDCSKAAAFPWGSQFARLSQ